MGKARTAGGPPADLTCRVVPSSRGEMAILSFTPRADDLLTDAERDIAVAVVRGLSNAAIAAERGASVRTVANQVASLMRKVGVASRVELAARFWALELV